MDCSFWDQDHLGLNEPPDCLAEHRPLMFLDIAGLQDLAKAPASIKAVDDVDELTSLQKSQAAVAEVIGQGTEGLWAQGHAGGEAGCCLKQVHGSAGLVDPAHPVDRHILDQRLHAESLASADVICVVFVRITRIRVDLIEGTNGHRGVVHVFLHLQQIEGRQ
jgi:hypothetical protein